MLAVVRRSQKISRECGTARI